MSELLFTSGAATWSPGCKRSRPVGDPLRVGVVIGYSEGNQLYAYDKAGDEQFFTLTFERITDAKDAQLRTWHSTTARGPLNTFTLTDEDGSTHTVRWMDEEYPLSNYGPDLNRGTLRLRKEI